MKALNIFVIGLLVSLPLSTLFGQQGGDDIFSKLNLTDKQKTDLMVLKKSEMVKMVSRSNLVKEYQTELQNLMTQDKLDEGKIKDAIKKVTEAQKQKFEEKFENAKKLRTILTEEQIKQLNFHLVMVSSSKKQGNRGDRRGQRGQGGMMNMGGGMGMRGQQGGRGMGQMQNFPQGGPTQDGGMGPRPGDDEDDGEF